MGYTVDCVRNGNWSLPRDDIRQPATKPPLYNWMAAPLPMVTGLWDEWVHKVPSILAGIATAALTVLLTRRMLIRSHEPLLVATANPLAMLAGTFWLASFPAQELMYLARPDMLLTAFVVAAWVLVDIVLATDDAHSRRKYVFAFWACIAGAAMTKGPVAVIPLVYALFVAKLTYGAFGRSKRLLWGRGLIGVFVVIGIWCIFAAWSNPEHFGEKLMVNEFLLRVFGGPPEDNVKGKSFLLAVVWFKREFLPWSTLAGIGGLVVINPWRKAPRWNKHALFPAVLWCALVVFAIGISRGKRADYLAPAYPAAAALSVFALAKAFTLHGRERRLGGAVITAGVVAVVIAVVLGWYRWQYSPEAATHEGDHLLAFRDKIAPLIGDDPEVVFLIRGYQPLLPLLGRHTGRRPSVAQLERAHWLITRRDPRWQAVVVSDEVNNVARGLWLDRLALYDLRNGKGRQPTAENLLELFALEDPLVRRLYEGEEDPPQRAAPTSQPKKLNKAQKARQTD
jgi:4-amino-4-deoxy-L-arabinose transferase-like glycosyltransferase